MLIELHKGSNSKVKKVAIDNNRSLLEQQILSNSGLKGKDLENLKARLAALSDQELQAKLSKSISGDSKAEWYTGVMLEHNESVVMKDNHDKTTYTDDNGSEISELKDGDDVLERTIKSTDDKGNVYETTVTFSAGRPLTQTKTKNGNTTETSTYRYDDESRVPHVTLQTEKSDKSKVITNVLEIDENGNFNNEDFIDRKTTAVDGTTTHIFTENNCVIEHQVKPDGKQVDTVYKGDSIEDYDNKKLNRVYQRTDSNGEIHEVAYDGNGNTRTVVQNGESPSSIAKKFGVKESSLYKLNPSKGQNAITQVGADVVIPGEYNADSRVMKTRKTKQEAKQAYANDETQRVSDRLYSAKIQEVTLNRDYKNAYAYAKALLSSNGVKNPTNEQINNKANEILLANGNIQFKKGAKVKIAVKNESKFAKELSNNGFKPTKDNAIFYNRFNSLNPSQQQNVLSVIKYCRSQNITETNKIKAKILETYPDINLFDSGKSIPTNSAATSAFQRKNPVALETFLTDTLNLDLKSETGAMVYERLASLPQEELNKINAQNFGDLSKSNFVEIAHRLEANGVDIRTGKEHQVENNSPRMKAEQVKRELRNSAAQNIALAYDNAINNIKQYQGNQGWMNVGFYREKLGKLLSNVNPTQINTCFDDVIKQLEKDKQFAVGYLKGKSTNEKEFKEAFKKVSGGVEYNENNMKAFLDVAQDPKADFNNEKYNEKFWNAYNKAFGVAKTDKKGNISYEPQVVKDAVSRTNFQQYVDGAGDIVVMLMGTEAIGKGVAWAGDKVASKVSPYIPKFLTNAGSKTVMSIGSNNITAGRIAANMASQSATFTLWDASKNYINLKTKDIQYSDKAAEQEWNTYKEGNVESAKFGAFAGLLNTTVVGKVVNGTMKMFEKPIAKAVGKVGKSFEKFSTMSGAEVMKTFMLNQTPGALAKTAGTIAEIGGFTLYETANEVTKELLTKDENGEHHLPAELNEEGLTSYLLNKLKGQAANLGEIKAISRLIFMHKGAIKEQARLMDENLAKCETLKNVKIQKAEINGREIFEVTLPDGNRKVANSVEEVIANCNVLMQLDMISNAAKENKTGENPTTPQGLNTQENTQIQRARTENPAAVVGKKIHKQWQQHDLETPVQEEKVDLFNLDPNAGITKSAQDVSNEVTSLILHGKLNANLTQRYDEMGKVFTEIAQRHSADIKELVKANPKNKQAVADGIVKILAKELGMEGFEPTVVLKNTNGEDGGADWPNGRIVINKNITNVKNLTSMISHEFVHMLQFRDVLAQYGEQGLKDLIANDKSIPENKKEEYIEKALNNPYNQHLLQSFNFQKAQTGTVNDYIRRIYKDEFTNTIGTDNMEGYVNQATERGAYSSQERIDRGLGRSLDGVFAGENTSNDASLAALRSKMKAQLKSGQKLSVDNPLNSNTKPVEGVEINSNGEVSFKKTPAGISTMSDLELDSQGRALSRRLDGTESTVAKELFEAVKNSELSNKAIDVNDCKLKDFKEMSRDYDGNLFSDEMLGYAKEMIECIPKGKNDDLLIGTEYTIRTIIMFQLEHAKPEEKRAIVDAAKKLMSNPHVRNGVVDDIIKACTEGDYEEGYTFNQKAFETINKLFDKQKIDGYEQYPIKNRENNNDYSYSLMISEIAKTAKYYELDSEGKCIGEYFDDIGFKIGMMLPESDPHNSYVHYNLQRDHATQELYIEQRDRELQEYIVKNAEETYLNPKKTTLQYTYNGPYVKSEYIDEDIQKIRDLCMVDGKLNPQNCFAVDYMMNNLNIHKSDIIKMLKDYKNQNGVLDMTMLRLIKGDHLSGYDWRLNDVYGSEGLKQSLKRTNYSTILELGKGGILYGADGHIDKNIINTIKNSPNAMALTKQHGYGWSAKIADISQHYMTDGKIDIENLKAVEQDVKAIKSKLHDLELTSPEASNLIEFYELSKTNPEQANDVFDLLSKIGNFDYSSSIWRNGRGYAFNKSRGGQDIETLKMYAAMPENLYRVVARNDWIEPIIKGEPVNIDLNYEISRLKPEDKEILLQNGVDLEYLRNAQTNSRNKKTEVKPQVQKQFEQAIKDLDKTLSTADVSRGIELEYSREQFEKELLDVVKNLPETQAQNILNSYGLTLRNGKIEGVISTPKVNAPKNLAEVDAKIKQAVNKFQNNRVLTQDPALNSLYTALTADFPEFSMLVGKIGTDGQRIDTTILKEMQTLINNPQYKTLDQKEQQMVKLALMFRGFSEIDSTPDVIEKTFMIDNDGVGVEVKHKRYKNNEFATAILERFNLTENEKYALGDLVAHSGWSKEFNGGIVDKKIAIDKKTEGISLHPSLQPGNNAKKVAVNTRFGTLKLSKLIEDVINPDNNVDISAIEAAQKKVYQNMQVVNSVTAKDLEPYWETQIIDGVECQVIDLRKTKLPDDFYLMGHFTQYGVNQLYDLLSNNNDKVFFSNSLIQPNAAKTFAGRTEGIISEFDNRNVAETSGMNIDSGFGKSYNDFVTTMSGSGSRRVAADVKENLNLTNEEYGLLMEQIVDKRLNELDEYYNINGRYLSRKEIVEAHNDAYQSMLKTKGEQNEITILNQRPIAYTYSASRTYQGLCPFSMKDNPLKRVIIFP